MDSGLEGKVVLITGASGGIGRAIAKHFAEERAKLVLHYNSDQKGAETLSKELPNNASNICIQADLRQEGDVKTLFQKAESHFGKVDILIANAGIWQEHDTPVWEMSLEQWNNTLASNLTSMFLCVREFCKGIQRNKLVAPSIVLIGSTAGIYGEAGHSDYAASKAAATYGWMLSLKNEICRIAYRGRINAICPSWVLTPMAENFADDKKAVTRALQTVPLRKVGRPEDVARTAVFLASERLSGHISGQRVVLAGGMEGRVLYDGTEIDLERA